MIRGQKVSAIIPARDGSKGLPGKNIRPLGGKPLIAHTIECARSTPSIDRIIVSSDSHDIAKVAESWGAEIHHRPVALASDTSLIIETLRDVWTKVQVHADERHYFVLLQPTSPLRIPQDVEACIQLVASESFDTAATFVKAATHPTRIFTVSDQRARRHAGEDDLWLPRQALEPVFELNGAVYVTPAERLQREAGVLFGRIGAVIMPKMRSIDIDDEYDFRLAEAILNRPESAT